MPIAASSFPGAVAIGMIADGPGKAYMVYYARCNALF